MDLQQRIDELWTDLKSGDIDAILKHFATTGSICLPKTSANSIVPFTGKFEGHQKIREFFELRDATIQTKSTNVESVYHQTSTAFLNVKTEGNCKKTGVGYKINDLHVLKFNTIHHVLEWTIYADLSELIEALKVDLPEQLLGAVTANDVNAVKQCLTMGADPNARNSTTGLTALMMAACQNQPEIVRLLLNAGADVFTTDSNTGATALHKACQGQSAEIAKLLTDAGSFIDAVTPTMGHTPIMDALWYLAPDVVKHIVSCKPNLNTKTHYGFSLWDHLEYETKVQATAEGKATMAAIKSDIEGYRDECLAKIEEQKVMAATEKGDAELVKKLIAEGTTVETVYPHVNTFSDGHTPLIVAARDNHLDIVKLLLEAGAEVDVFDWVFKGYPIHKATYNGRPDVLKTLLSSPKMNSKVINVQGQINGYTPLTDALWHGFEECANILLDHPDCKLGNVAHDGKDELAVSEQVFGKDHALTQRIRSMATSQS
jgi:ankyrin repeat protein/ketosteroid isomerase-like protein